VPGANGQFDVAVDGRLVYSKQESGRFPAAGEALDLIRARG